jgi:outer membrane protein assembly factor BamB
MIRHRYYLLLLSFLLLSFPAAAQDWPQWRGPNRDALVSAGTMPQTWPKTLKEEWRVPVGIGHASPIVAGGKIYVFARQGEEEVLRALDATTGKELWKSSLRIAYEMHPAATDHGKGPKSTPVVSNGSVCTLGISGVVSCHDARTGKLKWRSEFSKQFPNTSPLYGTAMSPVIDNGLLIAHIGGQDKGALTAFNLETGAVQWSNDADGPAYASPLVVTLAGVRQVVTFTQKAFVSVDAATGKSLWSLPAKTEYDTNAVTAVPYKDMLIVAREGQGLTALRVVKSGPELKPKEVWNNPDPNLYMSTPVVLGDRLYGMSAKQKGQFFALDALTGKTIWLGPGRMGENAAILNLWGKALLLQTNDANLIVLSADASSYAPLVQYTVASSPTWAHPVVLGKRILIKDETSLISLAL